MSDVIIALSWVNDIVFVSLVNTALQITLLISLVALLIWVFRVKSAATRYSLWLFVILAIILLPLLTPFIPQMSLARFREQGAVGHGSDDIMKLAMGGGASGELPEANSSVPSTVPPEDSIRETDVSLINPVSVIYFIWCSGMLFMSWVTIGIYRRLRRLRMCSSDVGDQTALEMLSRLKDKLGIRRAVSLKVSSEIYSPISMGTFSPVIIIPDSFDSHVGQLEMILTHELAHIKRCDYLVSFLQNVLRVIFFFHPLFYLMNRNLAKEREHICDDWVIDVTKRRSGYAECIIGLIEKSMYKPINIPVTIAMAERRRDIPWRLEMIADGKRKLSTKASRKALIATLLIGCIFLPVIGRIGLVRITQARPASAESLVAQIAFGSNRDGNAEIYVMDLDGKNIRNLTNHPADDRNPSWSPDGQSVAFDSLRDGNGNLPEIYVMDANGKDPRNLTNLPNAADWHPVWSPDGRKIAFNSNRDKGVLGQEVYVMDSDGKNQRNLSNHPRYDYDPSWSPDSQKIAYTTRWDDNYEIHVMDADGGNQHNLTNHPARDNFPAWSPDGQKIAFVSERDGNAEIYVMDADGKNPRNLTNNPAYEIDPSWSPDSKQIAFNRRIKEEEIFNAEIYVMDADGMNQRNLTNHPAGDGAADWFDPASVYFVSPAGKLKSTWGKIKRGLSFR